MHRPVSTIIPAHNEAAYIDACLDALLQSRWPLRVAAPQIIVVANGCGDDTAAIAQGFAVRFADIGWSLQVIDTEIGGKPNALNLGDGAATGDIRIYLDADVTVSPDLVAQLAQSLDRAAPAYAGGEPVVTAPPRGLARAYARFWSGLPFVTQDVPGFGLFAVNRAGRNRWGDFPDVISDDTFVRLNFTPAERVRVSASYCWPIVSGLKQLIQVRRRQDRGVAEIGAQYPDLLRNGSQDRPGLAGLLWRLLRDPVGFATYAGVSLAVRLPILKSQSGWSRGR